MLSQLTHTPRTLSFIFIQKQVEKEQRSEKYHEEDVKHLKKILGWANMCYYGGLGVTFLLPQLGLAQAFGANILGAFMMSTAICA